LASIGELADLYGQLPGATGSDKTGDISPFEDIQSGYWEGTDTGTGDARVFVFANGSQLIRHKDDNFYGWAPWRLGGGGARARDSSVDGIGAVRFASGTAVVGSVIRLFG
jgi:hypothetical protein